MYEIVETTIFLASLCINTAEDEFLPNSDLNPPLMPPRVVYIPPRIAFVLVPWFLPPLLEWTCVHNMPPLIGRTSKFSSFPCKTFHSLELKRIGLRVSVLALQQVPPQTGPSYDSLSVSKSDLKRKTAVFSHRPAGGQWFSAGPPNRNAKSHSFIFSSSPAAHTCKMNV